MHDVSFRYQPRTFFKLWFYLLLVDNCCNNLSIGAELMSNKNTKCVHIYFERYAETGTTQCLCWHCNTSSLVVVPLMGVETALAALKVSQSPYRGAPVIVVVNTKFIWAFYRDQEKHLLVEVWYTQSGAPIAHMMHNNIFKFNFLSI